jgi:hypothetical protein
LALSSGSTAINFGTPVGLDKDFAGNAIFEAPDAGIFESNSQIVKITTTPLVAEASAVKILCFGGSSLVTVSATGGTSPYTGVGSFSVKAGTHQYIITDNTGTKDTVSISVGEPTAIASSITSGTIGSTGGTTSLSVNASGGTQTYNYSINGSSYQTSNFFSGLYAGTYPVSVKDANGCMLTKDFTINAYVEPTVYVRYRVSIYPNPTTNYFILKISNYSKNLPVYISVQDSNGKIVYSRSGDVYTTYYFGHAFYKGTYYIKTKIGTTYKTYTVVKL